MNEKWGYCAYGQLNLAKSYQKIRQSSKTHYLLIDLMEVWSSGECLLTLVFDREVIAFFTTNESQAMGRITPVDIFQKGRDYKPWPLFEIKNSQRLHLFGIQEQPSIKDLRHFLILTDSEFIDVFAYYPPRMIVRNRADCDGKEHRDGVSCPKKDNIAFLIT